MEVRKNVRTGRWGSHLMVNGQVIAAIIFAFAMLQPIHAADFTCPTLQDATGALIGDVQCLIDAINMANANNEADTIFLSVGTYTLRQIVSGSGFNGTGLPPISSRITIEGATSTGPTPPDAPPPTSNETIITRDVSLGLGGIFRVFEVLPEGMLTLRNVIVRGGLAQFGGGIRNSGTLEVILSEVSSNTGVVAGAIYNAGILTLQQSAVRANQAQNLLPGGGIAGGIYNTSTGTVEIDMTALGDIMSLDDGNIADISGGGLVNDGGLVTCINGGFGFNGVRSSAGFGGGLLNRNGGRVELHNCVFTQNLAFNGGGFANVSGNVHLCTCQFSGNIGFKGGGIYNNGGGTVTFGDNCTFPPADFSAFIGNQARNPATGEVGQGGAIWNGSGAVTLGPFTSFMNNTPDNCVNVPGCPN